MRFGKNRIPPPAATSSLPWEVDVKEEDGMKYVIYSVIGCVLLQTIMRSLVSNEPGRRAAEEPTNV